METTGWTHAERPKAPSKIPAAIFAAAFVAVSVVAIVAIVNAATASSGPSKITLPPSVTARNCRSVAGDAHLLHSKLTGPALGQYYAAWVDRLAAGNPSQRRVTRTTLFDAGIAVAVCLQ